MKVHLEVEFVFMGIIEEAIGQLRLFVQYLIIHLQVLGVLAIH